MRRALFIFSFHFFAYFAVSQNREIDSLEQLLKTPLHDTMKVRIMSTLGWRLKNLGDYEKATALTLEAIKLSETCGYKSGAANAIDNLGLIRENQGAYSESMDCFMKALELRTALNDKYGMASTNSNMGLVFYDQGDYPNALDYFYRAVKLFEEAGRPRSSVSPISNIGSIYFAQKKFDEALRFYRKVEQLLESLPPAERTSVYFKILASNYNNIGGVLVEKNEIEKGLDFYLKALKIHEESGYKMGWSNALNNIGGAYLKKNEYARAMGMFLKALKLKEDIRDQVGIANTHFYISTLELKQDHVKEALGEALKSVEGFVEVGAHSDAMDAEKLLSEIYERQGNSRYALEHYKSYIRYRDSIYNEENTKKITRTEMNFEFSKKEAAAKLEQEKKEAVTAAESKKQKIVIRCICGVLLIVIAFAVFAYRSYLAKQRSNIEITRQKEIIEEKQKEIIDSIQYAKRIQNALLPSETYIKKSLDRLI